MWCKRAQRPHACSAAIHGGMGVLDLAPSAKLCGNADPALAWPQASFGRPGTCSNLFAATFTAQATLTVAEAGYFKCARLLHAQ